MNIICGKDSIKVSNIFCAYIDKNWSYCHLEDLEEKCNGRLRDLDFERFSSNSSDHPFDKNMSKRIENMLNKYWYEIGSALKTPTCGNIPYDKRWDFFPKRQSRFTVAPIDDNCDAVVTWEFRIKWWDDCFGTASLGHSTVTLSLANDILPAIKQVYTAKAGTARTGKSAGTFFERVERMVDLYVELRDTRYGDDTAKSPPEMVTELQAIHKEYTRISDQFFEKKRKQEARLEQRKDFLSKYYGKNVLHIGLLHGESKDYLDGFCGFDIYAKKKEIDKAVKEYEDTQQKLRNSNNSGEKSVEYALKWILAEHPGLFFSIPGDCESKHRYNCILLSKPDFIDEAQEYDHILVSTAGIILIETKHWAGHIEIRPDGKWLRTAEAHNAQQGTFSPKFQMKRHEVLMRNILPGVPIHSLLCFSNSSVVIDGKENFKDYPIIMVDQLDDVLLEICSSHKYSPEEIQQMAKIIEACKVNS